MDTIIKMKADDIDQYIKCIKNDNQQEIVDYQMTCPIWREMVESQVKK